MRKIALVNQKGGVGKTTTAVNLGAGLASLGWRVVLVDLDPQANASLHLGITVESDRPSTYSVLVGDTPVGEALRTTDTLGLSVLPSNIDLSGAELELAGAFGRETLLRESLEAWEREHRAGEGAAPADFVIFDCPPSLGLLSINGLAAATEVFIALQTEFFALQGMGKLVEVVQLLRRRIHPQLSITGIVACLYDSRLRLAREVLAEIRKYFPGQVFQRTIGTNVKLAEAPSYGQTIFQYAPDSTGARDYRQLAYEVVGQSGRVRAGAVGGAFGQYEDEPDGGEAALGAPGAAPAPPAHAGEPAGDPALEEVTLRPPPRPTPAEILRAEDLPAPAPEVFGRPAGDAEDRD